MLLKLLEILLSPEIARSLEGHRLVCVAIFFKVLGVYEVGISHTSTFCCDFIDSSISAVKLEEPRLIGCPIV